MQTCRLLVVSLFVLGGAACSEGQPAATAAPAPAAAAAPTVAEAKAFLKRMDEDIRAIYREVAAAQWVQVTYITQDTQLLASKANERYLKLQNRYVEESRRFDNVKLPEEDRRAMDLLRLNASAAPKDPQKLAELTEISARMEAAYGAGKYCKDPDNPETCRNEDQLTNLLATSRDYDEQLDAWVGWHSISPPIRKDYVRFVELSNEGARDLGFKDTGELWRSRYDMPPAEFEAETERLWNQVKPLYRELQCYVRGKLEKKYGKGRMLPGGLIPAHLTGNMWAQQWGEIYDLVAPYPDVPVPNITAALEKQKWTPVRIAKSAESFYVSLGFPELPKTFWERSLLVRPRDRDVVCHASAWDMNLEGDVRIKQCIEPDEDSLMTIYHEIGHLYYDLAYNPLPVIFQGGAHDGFHEAIGDTMMMALTPGYFETIGLAGSVKDSPEAVINRQMKMALDKIAFLPFGKLIDQWRWDVFSGKTKPDEYNAAWWALREKYQGVGAPVPRSENDFDPGAKYHIPGNTPYVRYFLAHILQFQFYKAMCEAAGHEGPLHECSFAGSTAAGEKMHAMLAMGQSRPWPEALEKLTGTRRMDASAIQEYFAPLMEWMRKQNEGKSCGWEAAGA
jgi:peptidyl-dipeptidase A